MSRYKYPKTMHLPWSPGLQNDDRLIETLQGFEGRRVIVTEKLDGENTTMYNDGIHARSIDGRHHPSRDWVKGFHGSIKHLIPDGFRVCGENVYAEHSIQYKNLETYFYGFGYWADTYCAAWDHTVKKFNDFGITPVPVLYDGIWDEDLIRMICEDNNIDRARESNWKYDEFEGYVVRIADSFLLDQFHYCVAKYVRKDHIQTDEHWMAKPVTPNGLKK